MRNTLSILLISTAFVTASRWDPVTTEATSVATDINFGTIGAITAAPATMPSATIDADKQAFLDDYKWSREENNLKKNTGFTKRDVDHFNETISIERTQGSNSFSFTTSMGLNDVDLEEKEIDNLVKLFVKTPLVTKYSIMEPANFIQNADESLFDLIKNSYGNAFKHSGLATFGKAMNTIRPHISYAIAISWNVQLYSVNLTKIGGKEENVDNLNNVVREDQEYQIGNKITSNLGRTVFRGKKSLVTANLRDVEENFENFVVDVQIWAANSTGRTFDIVANIQNAMRRGQRALVYQKRSDFTPKNRKELVYHKQLVEALVYERKEMNHYLEKVPPVLQQLIDLVDHLKNTMAENIMVKIVNTYDQTNDEIAQAEKSDKKAKFGNSTLNENIKKADKFLTKIDNKIFKSELDLRSNANDIDEVIQKKARKQAHYRLKIQNLSAQKEVQLKKQQNFLQETHGNITQLRAVFNSKKRDLMKCKILPIEFVKCFTDYLSKKQVDSNCYEKAMAAQNLRSKLTQSSHMMEVQKKCWRAGQLDVVFVIDGSGSVGQDNFDQQIRLLKELVKHMDIGPQDTRVALMQYSSKNRVEFNFIDNSEQLVDALSGVSYMNGGTNTGKAIRSAYNNIIRPYRRRNAGIAMVVITDGWSSDNVKIASDEMRSNDIAMAAVGYADYKISELNEIANEPSSEYVFHGEELTDLLRMKEKITVTICDINKCEEKMQAFEQTMIEFKRQMELEFDLYHRRVEIIDEKMKDIRKEKMSARAWLEQQTTLISKLKKEKIKKRTKLLQLKENQIRGKRVALVLKRDMEHSLTRYESVTDTLQLTKLALHEVDKALRRNYVALMKFKVQLENLKNDLQGKVDDFDDIYRRIQRKKPYNPHIIKDELRSLYTDNINAGVGIIVLSQLYDAIYTYMFDLDPFPVGLYNPKLTVRQNVERFQAFVKKMNGQKLDLDAVDDDLDSIHRQMNSLNKVRKREGMGSADTCDVSETTDINEIASKCSV